MVSEREDDCGVVRYLAWFEKDPGDSLIGEEDLKGANLVVLQDLFGVSADHDVDPLMYTCYRVSVANVARVQEYVNHTIDLKSYDYFVECGANESHPSQTRC